MSCHFLPNCSILLLFLELFAVSCHYFFFYIHVVFINFFSLPAAILLCWFVARKTFDRRRSTAQKIAPFTRDRRWIWALAAFSLFVSVFCSSWCVRAPCSCRSFFVACWVNGTGHLPIANYEYLHPQSVHTEKLIQYSSATTKIGSILFVKESIFMGLRIMLRQNDP